MTNIFWAYACQVCFGEINGTHLDGASLNNSMIYGAEWALLSVTLPKPFQMSWKNHGELKENIVKIFGEDFLSFFFFLVKTFYGGFLQLFLGTKGSRVWKVLIQSLKLSRYSFWGMWVLCFLSVGLHRLHQKVSTKKAPSSSQRHTYVVCF